MIDGTQQPNWKQVPACVRQEIARQVFLDAVKRLCPEVLGELRRDVFPQFASAEQQPHHWLQVKKDDDFAGLRTAIREWAMRHGLSVRPGDGAAPAAAEWVCEESINTLWKWYDRIEAQRAATERAGDQRKRRKRSKRSKRGTRPKSRRRPESLKDILARTQFQTPDCRANTGEPDWNTVEVSDGDGLDWSAHDLDVVEWQAKASHVVGELLRMEVMMRGPDFLRESTPREFIDRAMKELRVRLTPGLEDAWERLLPQALRFGLNSGPAVDCETAAGDSKHNSEYPQRLSTLRKDQDRETARHMRWLALYQVKRLPFDEIRRLDAMVGSDETIRAGVKKSAGLIGLTLRPGKPGRPPKPQITR